MTEKWDTWGFSVDPRGMQAMSQEMIRQRQIEDYARAAQYVPTLADLNAMANYRPADFVPKGWAEWSAYGTTY